MRRLELLAGGAVPKPGAELRAVGGFQPGDRIFHRKFGYGTVRSVEGGKLGIAFESAGDKMVMDSFVEKV
jgi:DNA helicase-2/ATP-dependent DNA helicase PcrA